MKKCTKCNKEKSLNQFHISKGFADKHNNWCKNCMSDYHKRYRLNPEVKEKELVNGRKYFLLNRKKCLLKSLKWKRKNKDKMREYRRKWCSLKQKTDIDFKMLHNLRSRILQALKKGWKSGFAIELLGCSIEQLKQHLESQFTKGMNWKNYGTGWNGNGMKQWHIDHIKPCASFDLSKSEEQRKCFNYKNLQPLWAEDNLNKGAKK
jgi:hypothetical protein